MVNRQDIYRQEVRESLAVFVPGIFAGFQKEKVSSRTWILVWIPWSVFQANFARFYRFHFYTNWKIVFMNETVVEFYPNTI